jgi:Domain of unknown function (DUF4173)
MVVAAVGAGLPAALLLPGTTVPGVGLPVCGVAVAAPVVVRARRRGRAEGRTRPIGRMAATLGALAIGLAGVGAVRASEWLIWACALAALCLGAEVVLDSRRWSTVLLTPLLFAVATGRALLWGGRASRPARLRERSAAGLRGLASGLLCATVVAALLASADDAFADLLGVLSASVDLDLLPARVVTFAAAAATALGAVFAVSTHLRLPGRSRRAPGPRPPQERPEGSAAERSAAEQPAPGAEDGWSAAEWLAPVVLVTLTIAAFLAVEATVLFGGAAVVHSASVTHAERAREGFGQLTVVTLIVLALLSWAGRRAADGPPGHRILLGGAGGPLLVLALLLAASALRRLWLYQDAYGWTVTRLDAGAFEVWVALLLVAVAGAWWWRRTDLLPRVLIGSAGAGLLVIGLLGPDALVARADVKRFEHSGRIDLRYAAELSDDAVPALDRLPEPWRSCALIDRTGAEQPWYHWNLASSRAAAGLRDRPLVTCPADLVGRAG